MNCSVFRDLLQPYLEDSLDEERRVWFRSHLHDCRSCRAWAVGEEPTLLLAAAESRAVETRRVEECARSVVHQIRQQRLELRLRGRRQPWLAAVAAMLLVVGGGVVWRLLPGTAPPPVASGTAADSATGEAQEPPSIEVEMAGEDVRVYQFATDDGDTAVYYVVNPAMEL